MSTRSTDDITRSTTHLDYSYKPAGGAFTDITVDIHAPGPLLRARGRRGRRCPRALSRHHSSTIARLLLQARGRRLHRHHGRHPRPERISEASPSTRPRGGVHALYLDTFFNRPRLFPANGGRRLPRSPSTSTCPATIRSSSIDAHAGGVHALYLDTFFNHLDYSYKPAGGAFTEIAPSTSISPARPRSSWSTAPAACTRSTSTRSSSTSTIPTGRARRLRRHHHRHPHARRRSPARRGRGQGAMHALYFDTIFNHLDYAYRWKHSSRCLRLSPRGRFLRSPCVASFGRHASPVSVQERASLRGGLRSPSPGSRGRRRARPGRPRALANAEAVPVIWSPRHAARKLSPTPVPHRTFRPTSFVSPRVTMSRRSPAGIGSQERALAALAFGLDIQPAALPRRRRRRAGARAARSALAPSRSASRRDRPTPDDILLLPNPHRPERADGPHRCAAGRGAPLRRGDGGAPRASSSTPCAARPKASASSRRARKIQRRVNAEERRPRGAAQVRGRASSASTSVRGEDEVQITSHRGRRQRAGRRAPCSPSPAPSRSSRCGSPPCRTRPTSSCAAS